MLIACIVLLAVAAAWGIYLAASILGARKLTHAIVVGHGVVAAVALVLCIITSAMTGFVLLNGLAITLLVLSALGGAFMFLGDQGPTPPLIGLHAVLAVAGFILLLIFAFAAG